MSNLANRMQAFRDTREVAGGLRAQGYWQIEAAEQIEGLWQLVLELYSTNRRLARYTKSSRLKADIKRTAHRLRELRKEIDK